MGFNGAQLHLLVNHFPVLLPFIAFCVLVFGTIRRNGTIQSVALWILIGGAAAALPTFFTGEPAESVVKNFPNIDRADIHAHENAALPALIVNEVTALIALALLIYSSRRADQNYIPGGAWMCALCLITFFMMARVAHLGGEIRHEEIQDIRE